MPASELELSLEVSLLELTNSLLVELLLTSLEASLELESTEETMLDAWLETTSTAELTATEERLLLETTLLDEELLEELELETRLLLAEDSLLSLATGCSAGALLTASAEDTVLLATLATTLLLALLLFELPPQAVSASIRLTPAARGNADFILTSLWEDAFTVLFIVETNMGMQVWLMPAAGNEPIFFRIMVL